MVKHKSFNKNGEKKTVKDIQKDFEHALVGIKKLPVKSRTGVYLAYIYYFKLFKKIRSIASNKLLNHRIRITNVRKVFLIVSTLVKSKLRLL